MPLDVFQLRERVVGEYRDYLESFVHILDLRLDTFVRNELARGRLWPDAVLQLNPAYVPGPTLGELADDGVIRPETARFFGRRLKLFKHQEEALRIAQSGHPYVVSTGTGSGKSLTYLLPIVDSVFRGNPADRSVRALVIYPMNALINSQLAALDEFKKGNWPDCPLDFDSYTGQTKENRNKILTDSPHILLTNYVMLEYMLIRPQERTLVERMTRDLAFLAMDELHVYRGRQGADVAMLLRRLRQRVRNPDLLCIGTSATIVTKGDRAARRQAIAEVGSKLFGVRVEPDHVVDETLERVSRIPAPRSRSDLAAAVAAPAPSADLEALRTHPLAAWVEWAFGLSEEEPEGRLVRRTPRDFKDGLDELIRESGCAPEACARALKAVLEAGSQTALPTGDPVFAFRLHQFLASGGSIYATLEPSDRRRFRAEAQYRLPAGDENAEEPLLYPLAFCRDCGQEFYLAARTSEGATVRAEPRSPRLNAPLDEMAGEPGYLTIEDGSLWDEQEELPDGWLDWRGREPKLKANYAEHVPQRVWVRADGEMSLVRVDGAIQGWWQPRPLMLCPRCRVSFDTRQTSDFGKLVTLSQTGRSTATTVIATATVAALREDPSVEREARKLLSFTDNRQDAALQAGHLNDFVQVVLLRGSLVRALEQRGGLSFDVLGRAIFEAMQPPPEQFMREPVDHGPGFDRACGAMIALLDYLALEDLARAWRVAQPNLEQCGLLRIEYDGLDKLAADDLHWQGVRMLGEARAEDRTRVLRALLDHLRGALALDAPSLEEEPLDSLRRRVAGELREPWRFDEREQLRRPALALLPGVPASRRGRIPTLGLGARSAIGRYLRSRRTWGLERDLTADIAEQIVLGIVDRLRGHFLKLEERNGEPAGVRLRLSALRWCAGTGEVAPPDPVRARSLHLRRTELRPSQPNRYFTRLYCEQAPQFAGLLAGEHTGQIKTERRQLRERAFRDGALPVLCCSPTMELGVDIRDLSVVHLRNVPPNPANYAQRSGRAGRGGRPALVLVFASDGNAHDHYFFRRQSQMIAGAVAPPRIDLLNKELIEAHLHSVWLGHTGLDLKQSIDEVLETERSGFPLREEIDGSANLTGPQAARLDEAYDAIVGAIDAGSGRPGWLSEPWLRGVARGAKHHFDLAFQRWRELYQAAVEQRDMARREVDRPRLPRDERRRAEQREREARRELELLLNSGTQTEADFYPYRYLAGEGFIPGYNFPRLPLRALVSSAETADAIDRPRFLGLGEFGPGNVIYHEGRRHRVVSCVVPAGGIEQRLVPAKLCRACGHVFPGREAETDLCTFCKTELNGSTTDFPRHLLEQPTVRAARWSRISSEEEERVREGYELSTHFRQSAEAPPATLIWRGSEGGEPLLEATMISRAELWRINHGWRRAKARTGFAIEPTGGRWRGQIDDLAEGAPSSPGGDLLVGVRPYVTDYRNLLLLKPVASAGVDDAFLKTLGYALRRAIQIVYQIEEQELAVELIGEGEHRRILLWEAAEGGVGIGERLVDDPTAVRSLAHEALALIHFEPETGLERSDAAAGCAAGCYDCLLSYSNQSDHRDIDRRSIAAYLTRLLNASAEAPSGARRREDQYLWLLDRIDPHSTLERTFLDVLFEKRGNLPEFAQYCPAGDIQVQVDFYYSRGAAPGICVFLDGPHHDADRRRAADAASRAELEDRGFRVTVLRHDRDILEQLRERQDLFFKR